MSRGGQPRDYSGPVRTCVGCRTARPKAELLRMVVTPEGAVQVDDGMAKVGRGAYLCRSAECAKRASRRLGPALHRPELQVNPEALRRMVEASGMR